MSKHQISYIIFGLFSFLYFLGIWLFSWPIFIYLIGFVIWFGILIYGAFSIRFNYHLKAVSRFKTSEKFIALTFDDGPTEFTTQILDLLKTYRFEATFFCIGSAIGQHKDILKKIYTDGHTIGNHSFSHQKIGFQSTEIIIQELNKTDKLIEEITREKTQFYRPPFGVTNPNIRNALKQTKHQVIGWNIRSLDTSFKSPEKITHRIIKKLKPGSIILMHDTSKKSVAALEQLLKYLHKHHYKSLAVNRMI